MNFLRFVLLPGLDGTSLMYRGLVATLPGDDAPYLVSYPVDVVLSYDDLVERTVAELAHLQRVVLIAESFSGPIALRVAERLGASVAAIVLIASFVENPTAIPSWMAPLARGAVFRVRPPRWLLRWFLLGPNAPAALEAELVDAISRVSPEVIAARLRAILSLPSPHRVFLPGTPLLYVRASRDRLISGRAERAIASTGASVQVVELDVAHLAAQRAPDDVWREIRTFVTALPGLPFWQP
jgi:pimeloyl-[acyl-carrier protein] methyl ester esterase